MEHYIPLYSVIRDSYVDVIPLLSIQYRNATSLRQKSSDMTAVQKKTQREESVEPRPCSGKMLWPSVRGWALASTLISK